MIYDVLFTFTYMIYKYEYSIQKYMMYIHKLNIYMIIPLHCPDKSTILCGQNDTKPFPQATTYY